MEAFSGKWHSTSLENFDELMKVLGVGFVLRKTGARATTYLDISVSGDTCTWNYKIAIKSGSINFKLGEEFDEITPDGRPVKGFVTYEDNKLVWVQRGKPHDCTITRTIEGNMMTEICVAKDVTCTRIYVRTDS